MTEKKDSYRQIMKATSVFGGVQVFQILISIIRSKFVAVLLGPTGMGVVGLLTTTTGLVNGLTNFGLGTIAVKSISEATNTGDEKRISTVVTVLRRMVWISGLLGALVTLVFSPWLSEFTFGNREYTLPFIWISVTLLQRYRHYVGYSIWQRPICTEAWWGCLLLFHCTICLEWTGLCR